MRENKRGQIWVSAALYTALGVILVTLILSVGMPFVNKLKERNTVLQTKNVLYEFDSSIREVYNEGFGSRRPLFVDIGEGDFKIYDNLGVDFKNRIEWSIVSDEKLGIEPSDDCEGVGAIIIKEGNLNLCSEKLGQGFKIMIYLDYDNEGIELELESANLALLSGKYNLRFEHLDTDAVQIKESS
jgi:hypothetical protein